MIRRAIASMLAAALLLPCLAHAEDGFPRVVERDGQVCMQNLDGDGRIVESCQSKEPAPSRGDFRAAMARSRAAYSGADYTDAISDAAVKYSWSGPLKVTAAGNATFGLFAVAVGVAGEDKSLRNAGWLLLGSAAVGLAIGLIIDGAAERDLREARARLDSGPR